MIEGRDALDLSRTQDMAKIRYSYTALNDSKDFRLVYLELYQPEETTPSLRCTIIHTKFVGSPKYTVLSHMWGPPSDTMPLVLKGQEIQVKKNWYSALWHLRQYQHKHHDGKRLCLWIDALCINEEDTGERTHQVQRMSQICS
jgi:hypothetical protein